MRHRTVSGALALSLACGAFAWAEPARVRLATRPQGGAELPGEVIGDLVASGPEALTVRTSRGEIVVKRADLLRLERSLGRRSREAGLSRGTLVGLGGGALAGALVGFVRGKDRPDGIPTSPCLGCGPYVGPDTRNRSSSALRHGALGGLVGAVAGAVYGAAAPGEVWRRERPDGTALSLAVQPDGMGARLSLRF